MGEIRAYSHGELSHFYVCFESGHLESSHSWGDEEITEPKHPVCRRKKNNISFDPCFAARLLQGVMM